MDVHENHRVILERRWPGIWQALVQSPDCEVEHVTDSRAPTLQYSGIHLTSCFDRGAEARMQASRAPADASVVTVYGFALGDLQRELLRRPGLRELHVVILNASLARASLAIFDHADWLDDPRVVLHLARSERDLRSPFCVAPACLRVVENEAERIRDLVALELAAPFQTRAER